MYQIFQTIPITELYEPYSTAMHLIGKKQQSYAWNLARNVT